MRFVFLCCFFYSTLLFSASPKVLTLSDAIFLALRFNPNIESAQLNAQLAHLNLQEQDWAFAPHYSFQAQASLGQAIVAGKPVGSQANNIQPMVTWLSPYGTQVAFHSDNPDTNHYNPGVSLQIMQPLLRGFGKPIVEAALENAKENAFIAKLAIQNSVEITIVTVIQAYLDVVYAQEVVAIDEEALKRAQQSILQTKLFIQAGHKAGNELITVQANAASTETQWINDKNNLKAAYYALLTAIGLDPSTAIQIKQIQYEKLLPRFQFPTLSAIKSLALMHDLQYQIDAITLQGATTRNVQLAEDNTRWQLNLNMSASRGDGSGGGENAGINSLVNGFNQGKSIGIALAIPIDDLQAKTTLAAAKIALQQGRVALQQEKWSKETNAINVWYLTQSAQDAQRSAQAAVNLQNQTYQLAYQKYLHGLIDSLELQSAEQQLLQAELSNLSARINYLKALANVDLLTGRTLQTWHIKLRFSGSSISSSVVQD